MFTREEISDGIMRINAMIEQRGLGLSPSQQNALRQDGASLNVRIADFEDGKGSWNAVSDAFTTFSKSAELVFGDEPVGATPVPAPAAPTPPTTPTAPPSGTSKRAPSQATPPAAPAPAPSPAPDWEKFMGDLNKTINPVVEAMPRNGDGEIIPAASQAQVDWLSGRTTALEADVKQMKRARKGGDFNFRAAGVVGAITLTLAIVYLVIMAQSAGYAFLIAGGITIVVGSIAGALIKPKTTDTSAA